MYCNILQYIVIYCNILKYIVLHHTVYTIFFFFSIFLGIPFQNPIVLFYHKMFFSFYHSHLILPSLNNSVVRPGLDFQQCNGHIQEWGEGEDEGGEEVLNDIETDLM